jgi:2',3'-cyclic-nucleotide 2'-phosphodiesterase (5'-nucleotidase family)
MRQRFNMAGARVKLIFFVLSLILSLMALSAPTTAEYGTALVVYHTNDIHGYAFHETDSEGRGVRWGYDYLKSIVDGDGARNKLLLDAGDTLHGQSFATARSGELIARTLAMMGYDAIAAGNHDFDYGWRRLLSLNDAYRLNFLSANAKWKENGKPILPPYTVKEFADLKVGVFGLSTPSVPTTTDPRNVSEIAFGSRDEVLAAAKEAVRGLKEIESVDIVIALTHIGSEAYCDPSALTIAQETPGIDLIVDGHSHSEIPGGIKINGALIVSTGSFFNNIGRVEVNRAPAGGFEFTAKLLPASDSAARSPNPELSSAMSALKAELREELAVVTARTPIALDGARERVRRGSTNLGRLICASLMSGAGADAAIVNGGMIRDSIPSGDITKGVLLTVLPYGNYVFTVEMTGKDLKDALNHGFASPGAGAFPQFYGMSVTANKKETVLPDGSKEDALSVSEVTIAGSPLRETAKYKVAITDFMYAGGDGYDMFGKYPYHEFGTLEDLLRQFLAEADDEAIRNIDEVSTLTVK